MTGSVSFEVSADDAKAISKIVERARGVMMKHSGNIRSRLNVEMDLTATHANGNPLRLADLLAASDADLLHDVLGIERHLDRTTGKLTDCFSPRFSARIAEGAAS